MAGIVCRAKREGRVLDTASKDLERSSGAQIEGMVRMASEQPKKDLLKLRTKHVPKCPVSCNTRPQDIIFSEPKELSWYSAAEDSNISSFNTPVALPPTTHSLLNPPSLLAASFPSFPIHSRQSKS